MGDDVGALLLLAAAILRRLLAQQERFLFPLLAVAAQILGVLHDRAGVGMGRLPRAQLLAKDMDVAPRLGIQPVFDGLDFFQQWVRHHGSSPAIGKSAWLIDSSRPHRLWFAAAFVTQLPLCLGAT